MKGLVVLGSTGSIGRQTLDIVRAFPKEFDVVGLAAGNNLELLNAQIEEFKPRLASCASEEQTRFLPDSVAFTPMDEMVCQPDVELVMVATIGSAGLIPTIRALENKKTVDEIAKYLDMSRSTIYRYIEKKSHDAVPATVTV